MLKSFKVFKLKFEMKKNLFFLILKGSLLEEWILQSFDEYIINYINQYKTINHQRLSSNSTSSMNASDTNDLSLTTATKPQLNDDLQQLMIQSINDYDFKKQEISFIIEQVLTNLLACGVLEFANGFENAINKIFKVCFIFAQSKRKKFELLFI